jgi:plastocyanin
MFNSPGRVWPESPRKEEKMKLKHTYQPQRRDRIFLVALAALLMLLLTACGGSTTSNTNPAASPTTAANTPAATTPTTITNTPPTSTATPTSKPLSGSTQVVSILTGSNGSFIFSPASLTITVGATVIWKNMSSAPHTITSDDGQTFDSGTIAPGGTYKFKFKSAGTYPYHCNYHPYMKATIAL